MVPSLCAHVTNTRTTQQRARITSPTLLMLTKIAAFLDGYSFVHYNDVINRLIVGNSGGLIKVFDPSEPNSEPVSIDIPENLTSLSTYGDKLLVTNTEGHLALLKVGSNPSGEELFDVIYRSELPLRDSVFINDGNRIVCGGDDNTLVVLDHVNANKPLTLAVPDQVVNIAYNSSGELLTVALANGELQVFSVINETPKLIETVSGELQRKVNTSMDVIDFTGEHRHELASTKPAWSANGEILYVPTSASNVKSFSRSDWAAVSELKSDADNLVDFALSATNKSVALLHKNASVDVMDIESGDIIKTVKADRFDQNNLATSLAWIKNTMYVGSTNGEFHTVPVAVDESTLAKSARSDVDSLFLDEASESETEELDEDDVNGGDKSLKRNNIDDSMIIDEDDEDQGELEFGYYNRSVNDYLPSRAKRHKSSGSPAPISAPVSNEITPYSPGSTPWVKSTNSSTKTKRRYLFMNSVGYAWSVMSESGDSHEEQKSITISFFDRTTNKDYHFIDNNDFDLCSLNERGVVLACSGSSDDLKANSGKIFYRHHTNTNDSWDRRIPLISGEYITSVCITSTVQTNSGDSIIVVGTNFGYLRFFNLYGLCVNIMKTSPIVTLISSEISTVFVIHQVAPGSYTYSIISVNEDYKFLQQDNALPLRQPSGHVPLIKGIFFNNYSDPCLVAGYDDSLTILSHWREENNARWVPVLNCKETVTDYGISTSKSNWKSWPLGCIDDKFVCLILKNNDSYPGFPLPLPVELDIKLPIKCFKYLKSKKEDEETPEDIANKLSDANEADPEEEFLRASTFGKLLNSSMAEAEDEDQHLERLNNYSVTFDKSLLKLFANACQDSRLNKAFSVVKLIKNDKALLAASKIAERFEFLNLSTKINKLREELVEFENED